MTRAETRLRIASYNVRGMKDDRDALGEVIRDLSPDVLFVQEAPRRFRWRVLCAELARRGEMLYAVGGLPALGNLILVSLRVEVHEGWGMRFPLTPGRHMRGAAFARCSLNGRQFVAVGTHLATDVVERPAQASLLIAAIRDLGTDVPIVLGGDVNDTPEGQSWRILAEGRQDAANGNSTATFSVTRPSRRIDALFVDPACRVEDYRVVDSPAVRRASDHFPICAEVRL